MVTLSDVAKMAGVTPMTVSRVVNNPELVKKETREKVAKAMKSLGYVPNVAAKNLATNRTHIIDVYIPESIDLTNPFSMYCIVGVSEVLSKHYYSLMILRNLKKDHLCDGYIVTGLLRNEVNSFKDYASKKQRPFILFGHTDIDGIDYIDTDNVMGGCMATDFLFDNGHKHIAMINVREDKDYAFDRMEGYKQSLLKHSQHINTRLIEEAENSVEGGTKAMRRLLKKKGFSAVFCATDTLAIGANIAIQEKGLNVPEDISLIGYDALGYEHLSSPEITSIHQPIIEISKKMADVLIRKIEKNDTEVHEFIAPELKLGGSVKKNI